MRQVAASLAAAALAVVVLLCVVGAAGVAPSVALSALTRGAFGDRYAIAETAVRSVPLLLTALAVCVAFRAGVWNIGGEGQFVLGGIAALLVASPQLGPLAAPAAIVAAVAAGGAWALFPAFMKTRRNAPEVLTTILLNFVALHLLGYAVNGPLQESGAQYPQSEAVPESARLASIGFGSMHAGILIAVITAVVIWWLLFQTLAGLRLRAVGLNVKATEYAGVPAQPRIVAAMLLSGALAGAAGGIELLGVTHRLYERFAGGFGYSGITVALLAQTHPLAAIASSIFIAALRTGSGELQRATGISSAVATLGEGVVIVMLVAFSWRRRG